MILADVNLLIYAHRSELPEHGPAKAWLEDLINNDQPFAIANAILSSFVRIVTHPHAFDPPSTMIQAMGFASLIVSRPNSVPANPSDHHWIIFSELCQEPGIKGRLVTDAYLAALSIEHRCDFATHDGDFKRFAPRLRMFDPLRNR